MSRYFSSSQEYERCLAAEREWANGSFEKSDAEKEFNLLVQEMKGKGFSQSVEVSQYIMKHQLGKKYRNIAGDLFLIRNGHSWKFRGGIAPRYYRALCVALGFCKPETDAHVTDFKSFASQGEFAFV